MSHVFDFKLFFFFTKEFKFLIFIDINTIKYLFIINSQLISDFNNYIHIYIIIKIIQNISIILIINIVNIKKV